MSEKAQALQVATETGISVTFRSAPTAHKHRGRLVSPGAPVKIDSYTKLIPIEECRTIITELEHLTQPAGNDVGTTQAEIVIGSYPERNLADEGIFVRAIASVFAETPQDIGRIAVDQITRACKWLPTRAEVYQVCQELLHARSAALSAAQRHLEEHHKRNKGGGQEQEPKYHDLDDAGKKRFDDMIASAIREP